MNVPEVGDGAVRAEYLLGGESTSLLSYEEENTCTVKDCCMKYPVCTIPSYSQEAGYN